MTLWVTAHQASLSITNSQSPPKHVHWASDAVQPSHPPSSPSPPALNITHICCKLCLTIPASLPCLVLMLVLSLQTVFSTPSVSWIWRVGDSNLPYEINPFMDLRRVVGFSVCSVYLLVEQRGDLRLQFLPLLNQGVASRGVIWVHSVSTDPLRRWAMPSCHPHPKRKCLPELIYRVVRVLGDGQVQYLHPAGSRVTIWNNQILCIWVWLELVICREH